MLITISIWITPLCVCVCVCVLPIRYKNQALNVLSPKDELPAAASLSFPLGLNKVISSLVN